MPLIEDTFNKTNWFREFFGQERLAALDSKARGINIPTTGDISLEYTGMNGSIAVKQADVVLKIFPLAYSNYTLEQQNTDLDYYAGKQSQASTEVLIQVFKSSDSR